jgi:uncharacterized protein (TIGR03435 family)
MSPSSRVPGEWQVAVAAIVIAVLSVSAAAAQQSAPAGEKLAFEAATIKLAAPDAIRNRVMPTGPSRLSIPSMSLVWLIYTAYGDGGFNTAMRVTGGPDWANRTAFAVEAVASRNVTPRERRLMLQALLEERFALKLRIEHQTGAMNVLVVDRSDGRLGPKIKEWDGTCRNGAPSEQEESTVPRCPSGYRAGGLSLDGATMFSVAEMLSLPQSRPLLGTITHDQTGLTGRYTMDLDFPFGPQRPADPAAPPDPGPSLFTAIREQWGLRVVPGKGPFKLATVESAQPPTEN